MVETVDRTAEVVVTVIVEVAGIHGQTGMVGVTGKGSVDGGMTEGTSKGRGARGVLNEGAESRAKGTLRERA